MVLLHPIEKGKPFAPPFTLQTDQQFPSIGSQKKGIVINPDTSVDVWFGPTAPAVGATMLSGALPASAPEKRMPLLLFY